MLQLTTGYRSGDPAAPASGESREGFDPSLPMRQRVAAKAPEVGIGGSTLWYQLRKRPKETRHVLPDRLISVFLKWHGTAMITWPATRPSGAK